MNGFPVDPDYISLPDNGGSLHLDRVALSEAVARWRRGEVRESLYQLEKAMDGKLHGLGDLKPEQLK